MKSAGNRGVVHDRLQVLHAHVFLVAPLGARHVAQPRTDQHQGGVPVRECPHHAGSAADLTVQPAGRKILCKRFSTKSRMALESRADSGLTSLINESHGGQNGMRAGTA